MISERFIKFSLIPMMFLLPAWLTFGRVQLGVNGHGSILYFYFIAPLLYITLLILFSLLAKKGPDFKKSNQVIKTEAVILGLLYIAIFLHGFFAIDFYKSEASMKSVATIIFGGNFIPLSMFLGNMFGIVSIVLLVCCFIVARKRSHDKSK